MFTSICLRLEYVKIKRDSGRLTQNRKTSPKQTNFLYPDRVKLSVHKINKIKNYCVI